MSDPSKKRPKGNDFAESEALLSFILDRLDQDKAEDIVSIDLSGKSAMADHMVIASGRSTRQVTSIAEKLTDGIKQDLSRVCKIEGKDAGDWVLIDAGDVIVHIFRPEVREFYQLEKMWTSGSEGDRSAGRATVGSA
ncbi:MAG: ribosome silencing factor [Pseudomonadota bacterium]